MKTSADRLRWARERAGYKTAREAAAAHKDRGFVESTYYGHENGDRGLSRKSAQLYAEAFGVPWAWLMGSTDEGPPAEPRQSASPEPNASVPFAVEAPGPALLDVFGLAVGGEGDDGRFEMNGQVIERVARPPYLQNVNNAYGVYVSGESMSPRYEPGELVYVHPSKPVRRSNYVVVQVHGPENAAARGYVKQFIAWTPTRLVLRQFNPDKEISFDRAEVISVHRIVGAAEV